MHLSGQVRSFTRALIKEPNQVSRVVFLFSRPLPLTLHTPPHVFSFFLCQSQRGKSFFLKLAIEHFYPTLSRTKISSVIYIGPEKISESYASQLRQATSKLGVPLHLFPGGPLTPKFQSEFNKAIYKRTTNDPNIRHVNNEIFKLKHGNSKRKSNNHNDDDDDDNDDDDDDDNDDGDDDGQTTERGTSARGNACPLSSKDQALSDECLDFFKRLTKGGYPSSNRPLSGSARHAKASSSAPSKTLGKKPKIGNFKKMKSIFSTDYVNKMGRGVMTRAAKRRMSEEATAAITPNKEITRRTKSPKSSTSRSGPAVYTIQEENDGRIGTTLPYKEMPGPGTNETATAGVERQLDPDRNEGEPISFSTHEEVGPQNGFENDEADVNAQCQFLEDSLILIDDAFCHKTSCISTDSDNKQKNAEYLNTLRFIQSLTQKFCHHYRWHLCITTQSPLSSAGTSAVSQMFRDIRTNLDGTAVFSLVLRDLQTLLSQIYSGEEYSYVKRLIQHLNHEFDENPADRRVYRPVLILGLNPSTRKTLQFR